MEKSQNTANASGYRFCVGQRIQRVGSEWSLCRGLCSMFFDSEVSDIHIMQSSAKVRKVILRMKHRTQGWAQCVRNNLRAGWTKRCRLDVASGTVKGSAISHRASVIFYDLIHSNFQTAVTLIHQGNFKCTALKAQKQNKLNKTKKKRNKGKK